jgi:hypothetical protein
MKKPTAKKKAPLEPRELTDDDFAHAIRRDQRLRIIGGRLEPGDVAALRRFVRLTQVQFAEALGISALLRIAARHPRIIRQNVSSAA